ncbi:MAG: hypothetical protein JSR82_05960 [Verrucomicrobia bacterium]|nr:hypothetical protein [Verrucomicrobiota bacterium]
MKLRSCRLAALLATLLMGLGLNSRSAPFVDENWRSIGGVIPGTDGLVERVECDREGRIYAEGFFGLAGGAKFAPPSGGTVNLVRWDGANWEFLGNCARFLTISPNGNYFRVDEVVNAQGKRVQQIVEYGTQGRVVLGEAFQLVGASTLDSFSRLVVWTFDEDATGRRTGTVRRWNGTVWEALGPAFSATSNAPDFPVLIAGINGILFVGGNFDRIGGTLISNVACWQGTQWSALGSGVDGLVLAGAVDPSGNFYVGGSLTRAGLTEARGVAVWDGVGWKWLGREPARVFQEMDGVITSLAIRSDGMVAVGLQISAGTDGGTLRAVAKWDGNDWSDWQDARFDASAGYGFIRSVTFARSGSLVVSGRFLRIGNVPANHVAFERDGAWSSLGSGTGGRVRMLTTDHLGRVIAAGDFLTIGGSAADRISRWDGRSWAPYGRGLGGTVTSIAADPNQDLLYAAGYFTHSNSPSLSGISRWNGSTWEPLADLGSPPTAMAVGPDSRLYAAGEFTIEGNSVQLAQWNGQAWIPAAQPLNCRINRIKFDEQGRLYAMGGFDFGAFQNAVAFLRDNSWQSLGSGLRHEVIDLAISSDGTSYAGGRIAEVNGRPANLVAKYSGGQWSSISTSVFDSYVDGSAVQAVARRQSGPLFVGGNFSKLGQIVATGLARWNGVEWGRLASGVDGHVDALLLSEAGQLFVAGDFATAGGRASPYIAMAASAESPLNSLLNVSSRGATRGVTEALIAGIVTRGGRKRVVVRALGPSLSDFGVTDAIATTQVEIRRSDGALVASNLSWQDDHDQAAELLSRGLAPSRREESALAIELEEGAYTAIAQGRSGSSGVCLIEVYDVQLDQGARLVNLSTRAPVGRDQAQLIGGFVTKGPDPSRLLVRALGPSLVSFGVSNVLLRPLLSVYDLQGRLIGSNSGWQANNATAIVQTGLAPSDRAECAIILESLPPGGYTAVVAGVDGGVGNALLEVFELP